MHVLFMEPGFPSNQREFVRALHGVGARVTGIGERPADWLDGELKSWMSGYEQVGSVTDEVAMRDAVRAVQAREWVDRLEAVVEAHVMVAARVREACAIPGTSALTAHLCRDKVAMKQALRKAGVPCAASGAVDSRADARDFANAVGFPLILKPRDGAGAAGALRVDDMAALERALDGYDQGDSIIIEEFVLGHEGFYDTLSIDGRIAHDFITHYYPNVLEAMRTRWISPQLVATNRMDSPEYEQLRDMGRRANAALGIGASATHMEWFFGPKGLRFSEIGCRPPGVGQWDVYCAANDFDLYREWAWAVTEGRTETAPSRRFACGMIALRPDRDGRITGYEGVDEMFRRFGDCVVASHFPDPGTLTQPVEAGYMANAWMRIRHPDYDALREILDFAGETVQVRAQ